jgi:serine/threonine-protein kinase
VGAVVVAIWAASNRPAPPHSHIVARATVDVSPAKSLWASGPLGYLTGRPLRTAFTLSPDGRLLVFSALDQNDRPQLYVRQLDELTARPIPATERARDPVFSPDGRWVAFWVRDLKIPGISQHGDLMKVPLDGGPPVRLTSILSPFGVSWMPDGSIVVGVEEGALVKVAPAGGEPLPVTRLRDGERSHRLPHVLPGGRSVLYTVLGNITRWDDAFVAIEDLVTGARRKLVDGADGRYVEPGYLAFLQLGRMMVASFDRERLQLTSAPIAAEFEVMQAVGYGSDHADSGAGQFAASASGVMAYIPGGIVPDMPATLGWVHRDGSFEPVGAPAGNFAGARLSPDGRYVAVSEVGKRDAVWIYDLQRGRLAPVNVRGALNPLWAPRTGQLVVMTLAPVGLFWGSPDASEGFRPLFTTDGDVVIAADWTPDEKTLVALRAGDILGLSVQNGIVAGERKLIATPADDAWPALSPDGRWLAYTSMIEGDRMQVFVQPFPDLKHRWQVSTGNGQAPCWGPQGTELFYLQITDGTKKTMMRVPVSSGDLPTFGRPEPLFDFTPYETTIPLRSYDISPDGKRFLALRSDYPAHVPAPSRINLVLHWDEELRRRLAHLRPADTPR